MVFSVFIAVKKSPRSQEGDCGDKWLCLLRRENMKSYVPGE